MRLTVYTDFALRLFIYVAVHPEPNPTIAEIAASYGVSRNHMMKVAYDLGVACYIETVRGKNAGLRLARAPEAISLGELVRRTEPDFDLVECSNAASGRCAITPAARRVAPGQGRLPRGAGSVRLSTRTNHVARAPGRDRPSASPSR